MNDYFRLKQFQFDHANNLFKDHTSIRIKSNLDIVSYKFDFKKVDEKEINQKKQHI